MSLTPQTTVRQLEPSDVAPLTHQMMGWWRLHWRVHPAEVDRTLQTALTVLAEDSVGVKGFMCVEGSSLQQESNSLRQNTTSLRQAQGALTEPGEVKPGEVSNRRGLIVGAGLRDSWHVGAYLRQVLPMVEQLACESSLTTLTHIGGAGWLADALPDFGFTIREWLINLERHGQTAPPLVPQSTHIRPATEDDQAAIIAIDSAAFSSHWRLSNLDFGLAFQPPHVIYVATRNRQVVGYVWAERYGQQMHFSRLAVLPSQQGRGIGAQLLRHALVWGIASEVVRFSVNTLADNEASQKLYRRLGFVDTQYRMPVLEKSL